QSGPMRVYREHAGCGDAAHDSDHAADGTQRHSFDQELGENVVAVCADRHAHTDFTRPLGHADQHDVHDADTTNHQRHAGDCAEKDRHHARCGRGSFGDLLLVANGEIVIVSWPDVVPLSKQRDDLLLSCLDLARIADLHVDVAQGCAADHTFHRAGVWHHHDVVLVHALRA